MTFREINFHPSDRELRVFSLLWLAGFGLFGALTAWRVGAFSSGVPLAWQAPWRTALVLWAVALAGSVVGVAWPRVMRPVYVGWMVAAFPIGWTISQVLLALVYFVVFTLFGLAFRALGRDSLGRKFDRHAASYWVPHGEPRSVEQYFKQF